MPWIAPWPDGTVGLVLTHDVETRAGVDDMELLRGPERAAGYRSAWNFVPERYDDRRREPVCGRWRARAARSACTGCATTGGTWRRGALLRSGCPAIRGYARAVGRRRVPLPGHPALVGR